MQLTLIAAIEEIASHEQRLSSSYSTRSLRISDAVALAELYFQVYSPDVVHTLAQAQDEIEQTYRGEYGTLVPELSPVFVSDGTIVGTVLTVAQAPWSNTPPGLFVIEVITHPEHRRQGLAKAGLIQLAVLATRADHQTIALRVESDNKRALALYYTLGFNAWSHE